MHRTKRLIIRVLESAGFLKALRWHNRSIPQVLMYHRIIDQQFISGLPPSQFEKQISYIAKHFRVVTMDMLMSEINSGNIKPNSVALTFDDGHYDFYENAWPILKKYKLPASLYITTGFVNGDLWLWPDLLKFAILNCNNKSIYIEPFGNLSLDEKNLSGSWHLLGDYCLTLQTQERIDFIKKFARAANIELPEKPVKPFTPVSWQQLTEMQHEGLNVGSHTVSHPILKSLSGEEIAHELASSAQLIAEKLGAFPKGICYPNGRLADINDTVIAQAKTLGYQYGLLARNTPISKEKPFLIGRLASHNDYDYFKWMICRHPAEQQHHYIG